MDLLTRIILESRILLLLAWAPLQIAAIAFWSFQRTTLAKRIVWSGFAALPLLMVVSTIVVTQREEVINLCRRLARAVEQADVAAIAHHIAPDFAAAGYDRDAFLDRLDQRLHQVRVQRPRLSSFDVTAADGATIVTFTAAAGVRAPDVPYQYLLTRWRIHLRRAPDTWHITRLEPVPTPTFPIRDLRQFVR